MILGCIDIGSNTTRLLVAEAGDGQLRELAAQRVFTCIRRSLDGDGRIPPAKVAETVAVVREQAAIARELGAAEIAAVATAAIREAPNREELEAGVEQVLGAPLRVVSGEEEARLAFVGAARTLAEPAAGKIGVVDAGGGSTEIAVGSPDGVVDWWRSLPIGSGVLADRHLGSDPPSRIELDAVRRQVDEGFHGLGTQAVDAAVAVGGTATSLLGLLGPALDRETLERGLGLLLRAPIAELAESLQLEAERLRVLPAGIVVLQAASDRLGALQVARGGLREGVILERAGRAAA